MPSGPEVRGKFHWKRSTELEFGDLEEGEEYLSRPGFHEGNQGLGAFQSAGPKPARAPRTGAGCISSILQRNNVAQRLRYVDPRLQVAVGLIVAATLPRIWAPVITFIVYAIQARIRGDDSLTTVKAFTALSIITLVTTPAEKLLAVLLQLAAAMGCFQRIHEYITSDPVKDGRLGHNKALMLN